MAKKSDNGNKGVTSYNLLLVLYTRSSSVLYTPTADAPIAVVAFFFIQNDSEAKKKGKIAMSIKIKM